MAAENKRDHLSYIFSHTIQHRIFIRRYSRKFIFKWVYLSSNFVWLIILPLLSSRSPTTIIPCLLQLGKLRMTFEILGLYHNRVDSISVLDLIGMFSQRVTEMSKFPSKIDSGSFFSKYHTKLNRMMQSLKLVKLCFQKDLATVEVHF